MGKLIVLGNGFDLHCGLKTSYPQYLVFIKRDPIYREFIEGISGADDHFIHKGILSIDSISSFPQVRSNKANIWSLLFLLLDEQVSRGRISWSFDNWFNVEAIMKGTLFKANPNEHGSIPHWFIWDFLYDEINRYIADHKIGSGTYLNTESNVSLLIAKVLIGVFFGNPALSELIRPFLETKQSFYSFLLNQLVCFEKGFGQYVKNQYSVHKKGFLEKANALIGKFGVVGMDYAVETFNYTIPDFGVDVRHINGDWTHPIFGIDNVDVAEGDPKMIFTKPHRRLYLLVNQIKEAEAKTMDSVAIYGHSFDRQDYGYFFSLFDALGFRDSSPHGTLEVFYDVYDKGKAKQIKDNIVLSLENVFNAYDIDTFKTRNRYTTLESLILKNKVKVKRL